MVFLLALGYLVLAGHEPNLESIKNRLERIGDIIAQVALYVLNMHTAIV
jgi:hypothetical protein